LSKRPHFRQKVKTGQSETILTEIVKFTTPDNLRSGARMTLLYISPIKAALRLYKTCSNNKFLRLMHGLGG